MYYKRQPKNPNDKGIPLEDLKVSVGHWTHSVRMSEVFTAKSWGLAPSEFDQLGIMDKAEMIALEESSSKIQQFESDQAKTKTKGDTPTFVID